MKTNLLIAVAFLVTFLASASAEVPPINSVTYDARGNFRVNEKPFFPILLYGPTTDDASLKEFREFGFNVLACNPKICDELPAKGFYGAIHANRKVDNLAGVFMSIGIDSPALNFKKDLMQKMTDYNAKVRGFVPNRPCMNAIGYWEDEPEGVYVGKLPSKEKYEDVVANIDVSAPYLYPVPYQPVSTVSDAVARARVVSKGKPILPVLQLFAWKVTDRYPTPAELRCMAFLSLVEGANGIGYYCYNVVTGQPKTTIPSAQPELWRSVNSLNRQIAAIGPLLCEGEIADDFTLDKNSPTLKIKVVKGKNQVLAVIVNTSDTKREAKLLWKAKDQKGSLHMDSGRPIEIKGGTALIPLEPFGVEIFNWLKDRE